MLDNDLVFQIFVKLTLKEVLNAVLLHLLLDFEVLNLLVCSLQSLV